MKHLKDIGETYFEHMKFAWSVSFVLFVHGLCPWIWETKASDMIQQRNSMKHCK